jgi:nitrite reductase/ring-hydroxylating ferredoxin subunit
MPRIEVAPTHDIPEGHGVCVQYQGEGIAVFHIGGEFYACDESCPHAGGPLHQGFIAGTQVSCPWHGWTFDLAETGGPPDGVNRYPVTVEDGIVKVDVPD